MSISSRGQGPSGARPPYRYPTQIQPPPVGYNPAFAQGAPQYVYMPMPPQMFASTSSLGGAQPPRSPAPFSPYPQPQLQPYAVYTQPQQFQPNVQFAPMQVQPYSQPQSVPRQILPPQPQQLPQFPHSAQAQPLPPAPPPLSHPGAASSLSGGTLSNPLKPPAGAVALPGLRGAPPILPKPKVAKPPAPLPPGSGAGLAHVSFDASISGAPVPTNGGTNYVTLVNSYSPAPPAGVARSAPDVPPKPGAKPPGAREPLDARTPTPTPPRGAPPARISPDLPSSSSRPGYSASTAGAGAGAPMRSAVSAEVLAQVTGGRAAQLQRQSTGDAPEFPPGAGPPPPAKPKPKPFAESPESQALVQNMFGQYLGSGGGTPSRQPPPQPPSEALEKSGRLQTITANVVQMDRTIDQVSTDLERIDRTLGELSSFNKRFMSNIEALPDAHDAAAAEGAEGAALSSILTSVQQIHDLQQRQSTLLRAGLPALAPGAPAPAPAPGGPETNIDDAASSVAGGGGGGAPGAPRRAGSRDQLNDAPSKQLAPGASVPGGGPAPSTVAPPPPDPHARPRQRRSHSPSLSEVTISSDSEDENARKLAGGAGKRAPPGQPAAAGGGPTYSNFGKPTHSPNTSNDNVNVPKKAAPPPPPPASSKPTAPGGASATSSKLKPFEDAARAAAGGAPSKPAPPPKPGARRPASAEGDGDEYEEVSTSSSGTPTHARGGHGGKAPEKGRGAGLVKRPSMRFAFDDAPPDEDDEYYNESEIERLAAEGQAPGRRSDGGKRSRDGSQEGSLRRGQRMHDPEVAITRRSRLGPGALDENRYSGEFRRSRSERNLLKAGGSGGARGPTGSSTNIMDRSLGRAKRGGRAGADESAPEESLGSRSSSSGSARHKHSSSHGKASKPLPPRPGSGRSGPSLKMSAVPEKRSSFAQGERDEDLYQNADFGPGRLVKSGSMPLLEPTGGGRGRGARGPAAVDEELGIEDEDYNANYEEEAVGGRARAGGRGGEDPFSEDDLDQESEERTGRSRAGNLAKSGKHARSRSVDLLSGKRAPGGGTLRGTRPNPATSASQLSLTGELQLLRGKTNEELEHLILSYLEEQKVLKLRQLMLAVGGGLSPSEALEPRLIDILHKYEREVNTLLARARAGSRTRMNDDEDAESIFSSVSQPGRGRMGLADDEDNRSVVSQATIGMGFPFGTAPGGGGTMRTAGAGGTLSRLQAPDAAVRHHHPPAILGSNFSLAAPVRVLRLAPNEFEMPPPPLKPSPKPRPPDTPRAALFENISRFEEIDKHAIEVAQEDSWLTWKSLVDELCRVCVEEVERVRVLFRWVSTKNLAMLDVEAGVPPETFLGTLRAVKYGVRSYHELFKRLCHYAGIMCEIVHGYSKGAGYTPGTNMKDNRMFRNLWTAVYVGGNWRFVNVCWGSRYLLRSYTVANKTTTMAPGVDAMYGSQLQLTASAPNLATLVQTAAGPSGLPVFKCDNFYFLTDPDKHIFEHLPDKKAWQLLRSSITIDDFMRLPILKSNLFNAGLELKKRYTETLDTRTGRVQVILHMPRFVGVCAMLLSRDDMSEIRGLTLVRNMDTFVVVSTEPPKVGRFFLNIYVNEDWRTDAFLAQGGVAGGYELACSFQVRCVQPNLDRLVIGRFPPNLGALGKTPIADKLGIVPTRDFRDPLIVAERGGELRVDLHVLPGLKVQHQMSYFERSGKQMQQCDAYAMLQTRNRSASYWIRCPADGFYLLTVYAAELGVGATAGDEQLECAFRYLIDARRATGKLPSFPRQSSRFAGCFLHEPTQRLLHVNTKYTFRVETAANLCHSMSVVVNGRTWIDMKPTNKALTIWSVRANTGEELGELSVYAKLRGGNPAPQNASPTPAADAPAPAPPNPPSDADEDRFIKLLDYELIAKPK